MVIGRGKGHLNDAQVLAASSTLLMIPKTRLMHIFLGQSIFHSTSIAIVTQKPTFMLDPYFNEFSEINDIAQKLKKKAILSVFKAQDAKTIGIIIGLKERTICQN